MRVARLNRLAAIFGAAALAGFAAPAIAETIVVDQSSVAACASAASIGRVDGASLQVCGEAIAQSGLSHHDLVATYVNRGRISMHRRDYASALADFDRAIELEPTAGEAWVDRGATAILQHRYMDGVADTTKGIELGVRDPAKAYFNRAVAEERLGDEQSAYVDYQQAMVLQPGWDAPKQELLRFTVTRR